MDVLTPLTLARMAQAGVKCRLSGGRKLSKLIPEKSRYRCPFYGFHFDNCKETFHEQGGDWCGFTSRSCGMKLQQPVPDWDKCSFACEDDRLFFERHFEKSKVSLRGSDGQRLEIPFSEWYEYVMSASADQPTREED